MNHSSGYTSSLKHPQLQRRLYPVAKRIQRIKRLRVRQRAMMLSLAICSLLALVTFFANDLATVSVLTSSFITAFMLANAWQKEKRVLLDYLEAARHVESENPDLRQSLVTAVQQQLSRNNDFFAERTASIALGAKSTANWQLARKADHLRQRLLYLGTALSTLAIVFLNATFTNSPAGALGNHLSPLHSLPVTIEPGDVEVEQGSSLVVTARFEKELPNDATLLVHLDNGQTLTHEMGRSLSDPVFAYSLRNIESSASYSIQYDSQESESYRIETYTLPKLLQADASLDYPDYTGWEDAVIEDTLKVSAIEGTALQYSFTSEKPVQAASLVTEDGTRIPLEPKDDSETEFTFTKRLQSDERYHLELVDFSGRENAYPPEVSIKVIANQRPDLRVTSPRGDQRLSLLEELTISGNASDDFGLLDYGIGFVVATLPQSDISLNSEESLELPLTGEVSYDLDLEQYGLYPKDTLNWFLWAVDYGPDGKPRRTTGDLLFAEIRSFDEIFRERDQGSSGQGSPSGQGMELIEKQRRISISLFRIKNTATNTESVLEDLDVVQRSQIEAMNDLQGVIPELQEASSRQHAQDALRFMEAVNDHIDTTFVESQLRPLESAWRNAQSAYDSLVKLSNDEYNVSRGQNQGGGGGNSQSRNQSQINELDFRQEDSRYETASEAQQLGSPDDRQNLELISRLNELSQRQDDLNQRLQELQSALAEAETEEERERVRRELKRLEEEQREMLAEADEAIQQAGNRQQTRQARQQLEEARENMRQAGEQMSEGQVSRALASGSRAQSTLQETREQLRESNSSQFADSMREARSQARDLAESQQKLEEALDAYSNREQRSLDDSDERDELVQKLGEQSESLENLLEDVQEIAEAAESVEPGLFRELYQVLRDTNGGRFEERYESSSQLLQQGFLEEAEEEQRGLSNELTELSEAVSQAASGILGSEEATLEFAQSELESLQEQLQQEQQAQDSPSPTGQSAQGQASGGQSAAEAFRRGMENFNSPGSAPLSGAGYGEWLERLRTVESLIEEPQIRDRISAAREFAENMRRDFKRHGELPQWSMVVDEIATPLTEASSWLGNELSRIKNPDTLQAIDQDPVPEAYRAAIDQYYESLGEEDAP
ncbi:DUF4175 family protein [Pelagicoccus mobilis]|uniref:DUF4175 family protein n=1 Tax=Pelagicoccus mobilis TaxID=415221 RepID=A0A934RVA5_9BACT|nr:DUF4175 family protein [Pelagicoccus mobilis]MBK1877048.1 hypothetical protein [Pelagicoccus mobilis]